MASAVPVFQIFSISTENLIINKMEKLAFIHKLNYSFHCVERYGKAHQISNDHKV